MVTKEKMNKKKNGKMRVTFAMPAMDDCLYLVGKFDEWHESVYRMHCTDDGTWSLTLELEPGREYPYRFRTLDGTWLNDPAVPLVPNSFKSEISFVSTSAAMLPG